MDKMSNVLNLDAPIVPGKSAAGISVGDNITDILLQANPVEVTNVHEEKLYEFGSVSLWVNSQGKVKQIGLHSGYRGKIAESIGIGSTISEVINSVGIVIEDEEDNLVSGAKALRRLSQAFSVLPKNLRKADFECFAPRTNLVVHGSPGWCFDSSRWRSLQSGVPDTSAIVTEIFIFAEDTQRFSYPQYPTTCPQCGREAQFDLILKDRRGVNSLRVSPSQSEDDVLGYGRYCRHCQLGWTGNELLQIAKDRGLL